MAYQDSADDRAPYQRLADTLRADIVSGVLAPGAKVDSQRQLADKYGVAPMTAGNAIDLLRAEGLVYTTTGRGTFVHEAALDRLAERLEVTGNVTDRLAALERRVQELERRSGI